MPFVVCLFLRLTHVCPTYMPTPETTSIQASLDALAAHAQAPDTHGAAPPVPAIDHVDRDAFGLRLQHQYHQHAVNETAFLLIALRGDGDEAQRLDFSLVYQCVRALLTNDDDWLVDLPNKRLIVLLAPALPDDARRFFARLKIHLRKAAPQQADAYLYAISAITLPNGTPFETAEDFLTVALDEE